MKLFNDCNGCKERKPACWGTCDRYQNAKKMLDEMKAARVNAQKIDREVSSVQYNGLKSKGKL